MSLRSLRAGAPINSHRSNRVVPGWQSRVSFEAETTDLFWIRRRAGWIIPAVEISRDCEAGSGAGIADEVEDFGITVERFGRPVFRDLGKQAVLDGIPFGSTGGVVANGYGEPKAVAELALKFGFPGAGTATVAATGIGQ